MKFLVLLRKVCRLITKRAILSFQVAAKLQKKLIWKTQTASVLGSRTLATMKESLMKPIRQRYWKQRLEQDFGIEDKSHRVDRSALGACYTHCYVGIKERPDDEQKNFKVKKRVPFTVKIEDIKAEEEE